MADCRKRAAESEGEGSTKRVKDPVDKKTLFLKQLLCDFGEHCGGDINKKEPRIQLYPGIGTNVSQTSTCSNIALEHYNRTKGKFYFLETGQPMDSTGFERMSRKGSSMVSTWFVHVNFWARSSMGNRELFFAELRGIDEPFETLSVVSLGHDDGTIKANSGEHFCNFCTGILHPRRGTFQGFEDGVA